LQPGALAAMAAMEMPGRSRCLTRRTAGCDVSPVKLGATPRVRLLDRGHGVAALAGTRA
jgi:hypothetical protein